MINSQLTHTPLLHDMQSLSLGNVLGDDGRVQRDTGAPCSEVARGLIAARNPDLTVKQMRCEVDSSS